MCHILLMFHFFRRPAGSTIVHLLTTPNTLSLPSPGSQEPLWHDYASDRLSTEAAFPNAQHGSNSQWPHQSICYQFNAKERRYISSFIEGRHPSCICRNQPYLSGEERHLVKAVSTDEEERNKVGERREHSGGDTNQYVYKEWKEDNGWQNHTVRSGKSTKLMWLLLIN